jgi:hypothetical protein
MIPEALTKDRYTVHFADMTTFSLKPPSSDNAASSSDLKPLPFPSNSSFNLIILDGHVLRTRPRLPGMNRILLFTQLLIGLQYIAWGGTIFIKLSRIHDPLTARILFMLDNISEGGVQTIKPSTVHSNRGTFYAIARRIQRNRTLSEYIYRLHKIRDEDIKQSERLIALPETRTLENNEVITEEEWEANDAVLDVLVSLQKLERYEIPRLVQLAKPVWAVQRDGMQAMLQKKGVMSA